MKVTIITATFNSAATIGDTLRSIQRQSYPHLEHIVIDGNSTDRTEDIVKQMSPETRWFSEEDDGLYDAMNKGIGKATGDIIGILNSDDYYVGSDTIEKVVESMVHTNSDTLYGDLKYVDKDRTNKVVRTWRAGSFDKRNFEWGWMPPHPTFFVRKHVYDKYGVFNTNLKISADYELMLRFLYKYQVGTCYLPECLVYMRTGGQSNVSIANRIAANKEDKTAWKLNNIKPNFLTLYLKPLRKISQYL